MAVQLTIPFEMLVELVEQLPPDQRSLLIERVQHADQPKRLTDRLLVFDVGAWPQDVTLRREDEYGDDGR